MGEKTIKYMYKNLTVEALEDFLLEMHRIGEFKSAVLGIEVMVALIKYFHDNDVRFSIKENEVLLEELPMTFEELVIEFLNERYGE